MNKMNSAAERRPFLTVQTMSLIGLMTALTCVLGPLAIPLPFSPVPISFTNLAVYLAVYVLGMKAGAVSYLVYLLLGMAGLPVFSGFTGGFGKLAGPTGGYLIGFIFMAVISGFFIDHFPGKKLFHAAGMVLGTGVCYLFGTSWLSHQLEFPLQPVWPPVSSPTFPETRQKFCSPLSSAPGCAGKSSACLCEADKNRRNRPLWRQQTANRTESTANRPAGFYFDYLV